MSAQHLTIDPSSGYDFHWKGRTHYLALHDLRCVDAETHSDDHPVQRQRDLRGRLSFIAAGCNVWGWSIPGKGSQSLVALYLDPRQMEEDLERRLKVLPQISDLYFTNSALRSTLEKLQIGLTTPHRADTMYLESLCVHAALELYLYRQEVAFAPEPRPGRLSKAVELRIHEFVEAQLSHDIGLNDLARIAGLSRYHFLRAFKATTGQTPYRYLLDRRLARAQQLLRDQTPLIADVARAVGFKDATRLIRAFKKTIGVTPGAYRSR